MSFGAPASQAAVNLLVNGDFESVSGTLSSNGVTTGTVGGGTAKSGQLTTTNVTGWTIGNTASSFDLMFTPGSMDTTGAQTKTAGYTAYMWGSNNGGTAVLPLSSPTGGNFLALDGDVTYRDAVSTVVSGLQAGYAYTLSFYMAGAQQKYNDGPTTESFAVTFGGQTLTSDVLQTPNHGFTAWRAQTMTFVASAAQQTLSFLSVGTPSGAPPFALLDGVSLVATPEPGTWGIMIVGLVGLTVLARHRRRAAPSAA